MSDKPMTSPTKIRALTKFLHGLGLDGFKAVVARHPSLAWIIVGTVQRSEELIIISTCSLDYGTDSTKYPQLGLRRLILKAL